MSEGEGFKTSSLVRWFFHDSLNNAAIKTIKERGHADTYGSIFTLRDLVVKTLAEDEAYRKLFYAWVSEIASKPEMLERE